MNLPKNTDRLLRFGEDPIMSIPEENDDDSVPLFQPQRSPGQSQTYATSAPDTTYIRTPQTVPPRNSYPSTSPYHNNGPRHVNAMTPRNISSGDPQQRFTRSLDLPRRRQTSIHAANRMIVRQASQIAPAASFIASADFNRLRESLLENAPSREAYGTCSPCLPARVDGGWSWVVMVAAFFMILLVDGVCNTVSFLLEPWEQQFSVEEAKVTVISAFISGTYLFAGPLASTLTETLGFRTMAVVGSLLAAVGLGASSFAQNVPTMVFTYGFLGGLGCCFLYVTAMVGTSLYFDRWRPLAVGFMACGSGVGIIVFSQILPYLLNDVKLNWRNVVRIEAGCLALASIFAFTFLPLNQGNQPESRERRGFFQALRSTFDISLFRDCVFWLLMLAAFTAILGISIPIQLIVQTGEEKGDEKPRELVTVLGVANTVGRLVVGLIASFVPVHPLLILAGGLLVGGVVTCCSVFYNTVPLLSMFSAVVGVSFALDATLATVIIARTLGTERLSGAFGLLCLARGAAFFSGAPIGSVIHDRTHNFDATYYMAGGAIVLTSLVSFVNWTITRKREFVTTDIGPAGLEDADQERGDGSSIDTHRTPLLPPGDNSQYGSVQYEER